MLPFAELKKICHQTILIFLVETPDKLRPQTHRPINWSVTPWQPLGTEERCENALPSGCWRLLAVGHKEGTVQGTCRCLGTSKLLHLPVVFVENVNL